MNDRFLRACRREPVDRTPVWIMRQAGRYLPEYREVRSKADFLTVCRTPELAAEVTLQPLRRFAFDAAIMFSDIMIPLDAFDIPMTFNPGPKIADPIRTREQVDRLVAKPAAEAVPFVADTLRLLRRELDGRTPVIGFCGAPFTVAAYLVQVEAGAQAIQIFDSWAGILTEDDYRRFALPSVKHLLDVVREAGVPSIYFLNGAPHLIEIGAALRPDVLGVC